MVFAFECFCFFTKSPGKLWPNFLVILFKYFVSLFSGQIALEIVVSVTKLRKTNIRTKKGKKEILLFIEAVTLILKYNLCFAKIILVF